MSSAPSARSWRFAVCLALAAGLVFNRPSSAQWPQEEDVSSRLASLEAEVTMLRQATAHPPVPADPPAGKVFPGSYGWVDGQGNPPANYPTVQLGGFFHADWGWFHQDANNLATVGDIQDGAAFRRARLNAKGDVRDNVGYMMDFDFGFPGRPSFMDVYMDIRDVAGGTFRFGHWRQPIGMDGLTSAMELTFLERALPFAFLPFRQIGFGWFNQSADESMTWAVSGFRFPVDVFGGNVGDNGGYGTAMRVTSLPWQDGASGRLLHLGAAYSFGDPANDRGELVPESAREVPIALDPRLSK